jgi:PII-like signaling protein
VSQDCLKLTVYFGERDRAGDRYVADALIDVFARHELRTSLVMRGTTGFGVNQHLRSDRLLSLSEDLPLVAVAVDTRERITAVLSEVEALAFGGLVTLERARMSEAPPAAEAGAAKLTVYVGRGERVGSRPAYEAIVAALRRHGVAGATVLLGVDGTAHGERRRARFLGRNSGVPLMVISVGDSEALAAALPELSEMLERPLVTWERLRVCKRDGQALDEPEAPPDGDAAWQKLMVYASEQSRHDGRPLYAELVRRLRGAGAAGATTLRGIWGYHGDHAPHGDSVWQLRRRVPVLTVLVDTPANIGRWYALVDELTADTGLVTSEIVPTAHPRPPEGGRRAA